MFRKIQERQLAILNYRDLREKEETRRTYSLDLSHLKDIKSIHSKPVNCIDFDHADERFLISGGLDGKIAIYDLEKTTSIGKNLQFEPIVSIKKSNHIQAPRGGIKTIGWYPGDTSFFISGGFDNRVSVWDTNQLSVVHVFRFENAVNISKMSPTCLNSLVAIGTENEPQLFLSDLRTGSTCQALAGHLKGITCISWNPKDEYKLVSGSHDGTIRLWDIRKPGNLLVFDFHRHSTNLKKRTSLSPIKASSSTSTEIGGNDIFSKLPTNSAISHQGIVTDVHFLNDGSQILSTGTDHMMRLWDATFGYNMLVNYPDIRNPKSSPAKMCISTNGMIAYHPSKHDIIALEIQSGRKVNRMYGHFSNVTSMAFNSSFSEMYSGAEDGQILVWTSPFDEQRFLSSSETKVSHGITARTRSMINNQYIDEGLEDDRETRGIDWNSDDDEVAFL